MKLTVFSNKAKHKFCIGLNSWSFNECSDENLKDVVSILNYDEKDITELEQRFGATTIYYSFTESKEVPIQKYQEQFINYDSDKCHITPVTTFSSREQAEKCLIKLNELNNIIKI